MQWRYIDLRIECLPVRQTGNSKKDKYWREVQRQKPEERYLITLFQLRTPVFSHRDSFGRTPVKIKEVYRNESNCNKPDCRQASLQGQNQ